MSSAAVVTGALMIKGRLWFLMGQTGHEESIITQR